MINLNIAFNYGFKNEIKRVLDTVVTNKRINLENENDIKKLFYLVLSDPDLLIRTGGYKRLVTL